MTDENGRRRMLRKRIVVLFDGREEKSQALKVSRLKKNKLIPHIEFVSESPGQSFRVSQNVEKRQARNRRDSLSTAKSFSMHSRSLARSSYMYTWHEANGKRISIASVDINPPEYLVFRRRQSRRYSRLRDFLKSSQTHSSAAAAVGFIRLFFLAFLSLCS